jgi:hypothetical protein
MDERFSTSVRGELQLKYQIGIGSIKQFPYL